MNTQHYLYLFRKHGCSGFWRNEFDDMTASQIYEKLQILVGKYAGLDELREAFRRLVSTGK